MAFVGIDVSKLTLDVAVLWGTGDVEHRRLDNSPDGHVGQDVLPVVVAACQRETDVGSGPLGLGQRADGRQEDGAEYALWEMKAPGR